MAKRRILHIDMDAFFAAVEEKRHPELAGKPVVIGGSGDTNKRGVVSTASYEARKYGIHSAMPLSKARKLCPEAAFLPVDYKEYSRISKIVKSVLREFTHAVEDVGIDEAFLDISDIELPSESVAREIKRRVVEVTHLACSIGIGPNKLVAKIASDMDKPDGLTIIEAEDIEDKFSPLTVRKLWGIGPKTEEHLHRMNVDTVAQLAALPRENLEKLFGRSHGNFLFRAARGIDDAPLVTHWEPKSVSRELTFQRDVSHWQTIAKTLAELAREVARDLKKNDRLARTFSIKIRFYNFETCTRSKTMGKAIDDEALIRKIVFECLKRIDLARRIRLIGVRATNLEKRD